MLKVVIDGMGGPYVAHGTYVTEDDRYLILNDSGVKVNIPISKIVKIEDLRGVVERTAEPPALELAPMPEPTLEAPSPNKPPATRLDPETLQKMLRDKKRSTGRKNPNVMPAIVEPGAKKTLFVSLTGAANKNLSVEVPEHSFIPGVYTPTLQKELAITAEIKSIMESGIVFDGVPEVRGDNVYIKTRKLEEQVSNVMGKMGIAGKALGAMQSFTQPQGNFQTDFSMGAKNETPFVATNSPFDGPVLLGEDDEPGLEDLRLTEEDSEETNDNSAEEAPASEEPVEGDVPEVQG